MHNPLESIASYTSLPWRHATHDTVTHMRALSTAGSNRPHKFNAMTLKGKCSKYRIGFGKGSRGRHTGCSWSLAPHGVPKGVHG